MPTTSSDSIPAIVLVGEPGDALAQSAGAQAKGLIPLGGRPLVTHMVEALRAYGSRIVVVANPILEAEVVRMVDVPFARSSPKISEKLRAGFEALGAPHRALVCAADSPFVSAGGLAEFAAEASRRGLDLAYPIVPRAICDEKFPGTRRTYVRVREGEFTGGNVLVLSWPLVRDRSDRIERFFAARKSPLKLASLLGPALVLKLLMGRLCIAELEGCVSRLLGGPAGAVISDDAGLGFDIDKPEDLELALSLQPPGHA